MFFSFFCCPQLFVETLIVWNCKSSWSVMEPLMFCRQMQNNNFEGSIPVSFAELPNLVMLWVNFFEIFLHGLFSELTYLLVWDRENSWPWALCNFRDLDNNNLTGDVPQALLTKIMQSSLTFSWAPHSLICRTTEDAKMSKMILKTSTLDVILTSGPRLQYSTDIFLGSKTEAFWSCNFLANPDFMYNGLT